MPRASNFQVHLIPAFTDNYIFYFRGLDGRGFIVDPGDGEVVQEHLEAKGWPLDVVLVTHHHADHVGGLPRLVARYRPVVYGPEGDRKRVPEIEVGLQEGDLQIGSTRIQVLAVPGHTAFHLTYYLPEASVAFVGDTLFSMGCGRLFEGTAAQLWSSLNRIMNLPDTTEIYCAHEYTLKNARFALSITPDHLPLAKAFAEASSKQSQGLPTVPFTLGREKTINPFLRPGDLDIRTSLSCPDAPASEIFAELRRRRDHF